MKDPLLTTVEQENAVYSAICDAANTSAREQRILGSGEIFKIMRENGVVTA